VVGVVYLVLIVKVANQKKKKKKNTTKRTRTGNGYLHPHKQNEGGFGKRIRPSRGGHGGF